MNGLAEPSSMVCFMRQVVASVAFLHEQGVVHRDIKEANFLLTARHIHVDVTVVPLIFRFLFVLILEVELSCKDCAS